jgi:hypothetical protein
MPTAVDELAALRTRLAYDFPFFAEYCLKIVPKKRSLGIIPFTLNSEQRRLDDALEEQRLRGEPPRAIVLKSRRIGFSTYTQGKLLQHVTQHPNREALVVAQNKDTAGALFGIGQLMYQYLPPDPDLGIKPQIASRRRKNELHFGNKSQLDADMGNIGINSRLRVDTAQEAEAGRGNTYTAVHASEVAFWPDIETKLLGLLSAVPTDEDTLVILESTANGNNFFRDLWDAAVDGTSGYVPFFAPWQEDVENVRPFLNDDDRAGFEKQIGSGPYGEEEPELLERFSLSSEQLHWRRWRIDQPDIGGDLRKFHQEFPAYPEQAFISTGSHVFDQRRVQMFVDRTLKVTDPKTGGPKLGILTASLRVAKKGRHGTVEVPTEVKWTASTEANLGPNHPYWRVWEEPDPEGRYIVIADPAEGEEIERGESDYHGIQVLNHGTRAQVAEYRSRIDPDLAGEQLYLAALHWNRALIVVEKTGGYGTAMLRRIYFDYKYPRPLVYFRRSHDSSRDREEDRLGWSTDRATKPLVVSTGVQVIREATDPGGNMDVVRSRLLAEEMTSYMRDERGRTGARKGRHDDLLMPWLVGHQVADEVQPRPDRKGQQVRSMLSASAQRRWQIR